MYSRFDVLRDSGPTLSVEAVERTPTEGKKVHRR